jgi:hypothetical protein
MSFNRLNYDECTYKHNLRQSMGTGDYLLNTPTIDCQSCFPADPAMKNPRGVSICGNRGLIDVDSELIGINKKASNCPNDKYIPQQYCSLNHVPDCKSLPQEDTRISNPPCTLRSTGWNRWEWLCRNPQEKALVPFDFNISYRTIVKDNHRPCLPKPINQLHVLPPNHFSEDVVTSGFPCSQEVMDIPSVHWRSCSTYEPYKLPA